MDLQPWFAARYLGRWLNPRVEDGVRRSLLRWQALELDVLHWQGQLWVPYGELPRLIAGQAIAST